LERFSVTEYRAQLLDQMGRVTRGATFIRAETDEEAIEAAEELVDEANEGRGIELWQGDRLVATLKRKV
jgi:alkanesulfonate monooxygenase SsuD/methylene tetrahydromethanopterin reductase-like flavin-dependent oxidoreductase (luciferase family)